MVELLYGEFARCENAQGNKVLDVVVFEGPDMLSSVEFVCMAWRNDAVWFLYLVSKSFSVSPMYVSVVLLSLRVTVAW